MYCEDEDWCFRARQAGWKVCYNPGASIIHYKGSSAQKRKARMIYEWQKATEMHLLGNRDDCLEIVVTSDVFCLSPLWVMSLSYTNTIRGRVQRTGRG